MSTEPKLHSVSIPPKTRVLCKIQKDIKPGGFQVWAWISSDKVELFFTNPNQAKTMSIEIVDEEMQP